MPVSESWFVLSSRPSRSVVCGVVCWNLRQVCGFRRQDSPRGRSLRLGYLTLFSVEHVPAPVLTVGSRSGLRSEGRRVGVDSVRCHCPHLVDDSVGTAGTPDCSRFPSVVSAAQALSPSALMQCRGARVSPAALCQSYPRIADIARGSSRARQILRPYPESRGCRKRPRFCAF